MGKVYARAIIAGSRTLKSISDLWFDATFKALSDFLADGTCSEERFAEILAQAREDGVINIPEDAEIEASA